MSAVQFGDECWTLDCTYQEDPRNEGGCGQPGVKHACWVPDMVAAVACRNHVEATRELEPYQMHDMGPNCQMPGSVWDFKINECVVPEENDFLSKVKEEVLV